MAPKTNLDLVKECDNFPYPDKQPKVHEELTSTYYQFKTIDCDASLGYIPSWVVERMPWSKACKIDDTSRTVLLGGGPESSPSGQTGSVQSWTKPLEEIVNTARAQETFKVLAGWRNELYPVYGPHRRVVMDVERAASALLGIVTYGVHMTVYVNSSEGIKIWAPRRAKTKQTYGGMMDNTVAGGISTGEKPFECLVREAEEEASLPEDIVRKGTKACGTVTYFHIRDTRAGGEAGLCQPECQFVYDLEVSDSVIPKPGDNEAEDFRLLTVAEVQKAMADGEFKPNCALVLLDFFVRHGILTVENEENYIEIVARIHRRLEFSTL